jgi:hypothetical protein
MAGLAVVPGLSAVAAVTPDNTPHGYNLTFAVPIAVFAVVAVALYLLFSRPHQRIPARPDAGPAGTGGPAGRLVAPDPAAARAAAVAGGLAVAAGGGAAETHLEPGGHVYATPEGAEPAPGPGEGAGGEAGAAEAGAAEAGAAGAGGAGQDAQAGPPDGGGPAPDDQAGRADQAEDGQ